MCRHPLSWIWKNLNLTNADLSFTVDNQIEYGSPAQIEIIYQQGDYTFRDTLTKIRADFKTLVSNDGDISQWDISEGMGWELQTETYLTGPVSITDSPGSRL